MDSKDSLNNAFESNCAGQKVSVIVPVYNTAQYLRDCIDSLVNQTYKNIEIIVVNDGSKDNSLEIINEYASKYPNIILINQENKGYSGARNVALEKVTGDYVGFVDSDDYIAPDMFQKLMSAAQNSSADIVSCSFFRVFNEKDSIIQVFDSNKFYFDLLSHKRDNDLKCTLKNYGELLLDDAFVWNRIYKTKMLKDNNIVFPDDIFFGEDTYFHRNALYAANNIAYIKEPLYYYRQGRIGAQTTLTDIRNMSFIKNCENLYKIASKYNLESSNSWLNHLTLSLCATGYERIAKEYKDEYYTNTVNLIKSLDERFIISYPDCKNAALSVKMRYFILRLLHPLQYLALKNNYRFLFDSIIQLRIIIQKSLCILNKLIQRN